METELSQILLDGAMYEWVKANADEQGAQLKCKRLPRSLSGVGSLRPERIESLRRMETVNPSVWIRPFRDTLHYEVVDGRHRVVLAIQRGDRTISCELIDKF